MRMYIYVNIYKVLKIYIIKINHTSELDRMYDLQNCRKRMYGKYLKIAQNSYENSYESYYDSKYRKNDIMYFKVFICIIGPLKNNVAKLH